MCPNLFILNMIIALNKNQIKQWPMFSWLEDTTEIRAQNARLEYVCHHL